MNILGDLPVPVRGCTAADLDPGFWRPGKLKTKIVLSCRGEELIRGWIWGEVVDIRNSFGTVLEIAQSGVNS